ncbi:hypothetical protein [Streptococcus pluranimalium]|uniref:Uncharacterized protein n=1 Tax=Streptococcus pluranimalium TaxID=82348 RepID=A0A345VIF2_9STRE|nr:hypothetical protein [Streptococcus pluranimalium]AXJ12464.1 hypothetical protein Sp14A_05340 [Streptococcus pluranimalium]AXJ12504.1 hypothetical protein Sp14A_05740 [Streptococcus pluranimalium]
MLETQDNFKPQPSNVTDLHSKRTSLHRKNDIINSRDKMEEAIMPQDTYSKSEIDLKFEKISSDVQYGFDKVDLKFEKLEQKMSDGFKQVDLKFDNFERRIENLLLTQENKRLDEQARNKKEFMYWAIGILIALAGIAFPIWFGK